MKNLINILSQVGEKEMPFADIRIKFWRLRAVFRKHIHVIVYLEIPLFVAEKIEQLSDEYWKGKVYNIETMLYSLATESV